MILNNKVFVPVFGSSWDDEALAVYSEALPGYEVIGFNGSWESTDALHCRVKGIPDLKMLQIFHFNNSTFAFEFLYNHQYFNQQSSISSRQQTFI